MKKYHFNIRINIKDNNAGSKATEDCKTILIRNGFEDLELSFIRVWYLMPLNLIKLFIFLGYYFLKIKSGSIILVQYPLLGINDYFKHYIKLLKVKECKLCAIIHDLDSLRSVYDHTNIRKELDRLLPYDAVISHNAAMSRWLQQNGYPGHAEEILLFDYLANCNGKEKSNVELKTKSVVFAGNLGRGNFLPKLAQLANAFYLKLYGPGFSSSISENNSKVKWYGSFTPSEIVNKVDGDFGLIWDGDSTEEITGLMGNYVRYNTPHKTSLYLASGIPVIISRDAAIAPFIEANDIGVSINKLSEIEEKAFGLDAEQYDTMKANASLIGQKVREGDYLSDAVAKIEGYLLKNNL